VSKPAPGAAASYAFLRSGRWIRLVVIAIVVALACVALGRWQWTRHVARSAEVARIESNYAADPIPLSDVLTAPDAALPDDAEWRPVEAAGTYANDGSVVLRARPVEGTPAVHVLAPLVVTMADGARAVLIVDRGWLPAGSEEVAGGIPDPPEGQVRVEARMRPPEEPSSRVGPPGQVYAIDPPAVLAASGAPADVTSLPVLEAYAVLVSEDPPAAVSPVTLPAPGTGLGSNLSYAFQWWVFALGALVGVVVLARREATATAVGAPSAASARATTPPRRRRPSAEDEEDALVEAALQREEPQHDRT